jgi:hypothetical protein
MGKDCVQKSVSSALHLSLSQNPYKQVAKHQRITTLYLYHWLLLIHNPAHPEHLNGKAAG